ncbi:MAG TPA: TonB-dependent receptor, partial [Gemmatimonadaceae bacterium]|nr:TonB-dependent receptor [Gemmatimonadaceae bacterium]
MRATSVRLVGLAALLASVAGLPRVGAQGPQGNPGLVQGTVRSEAGTPVPDVGVTVRGTHLGATTRGDGRYTISAVPPGTYRLRAMRIGYAMQEREVTVAAGQTATADFALAAAAVVLDQVVVVGYGTQLKRDMTGSVASVSSAEIATMPVPRVEQALSGLVPGVQVQTTNAQPGSQLRIRIRGGNSLNGSNEPLVVVDGVIGVDLNQISPNDIESVDVLKDASSTAIYGSRAANGVILVTTKRGQPGKMRFEYNGYSGAQEVTKQIDVLGAAEFARLYMRNPSRDKSVTFDTLHLDTLPNTDWQDAVYRTAPIQNHELRVSGSTGGTRLMLSGGLFQQRGIVTGSSFDRGSLRFNLDQELGERFQVGTRVVTSRSVGNEVRVNDGYGSDGGPITMMALRFAPTIPVYDSTGGFSAPLLPSQTMDNPLAIARLRDNKTTNDYLLGNVFGEYNLMEGVALRGSVGYTAGNVLQQRYTSRLLRAAFNRGQANIDNTHRTTWLAENTLTLQRTLWGRHDVTLLGGMTVQQTRRSASAEEGKGFTSDLLGYRRLNLAEEVNGTSSASLERQLSYLGRANVSLWGKYLLTGTFRADGSSKFAVNNKWAYFPSAAVAWRASDEPFLRGLAPVLSELKLRTSYGRTGSEAINAYQSMGAWTIGSIYAIGTTLFRNGASPGRNSNPNLRWETTDQYDAGVDLGLFDNRVSVTADVYHKKTHDLLYQKQVAYYTGFESYVANIGKVQNRGLEVALDTRHAVGPFQLRLGGNVALNRNKVLDLGGDREFFLAGANGSLPLIRDGAIVRVGEPLGNFYGYISDGIFQNAATAAASGQVGAVAGSDRLRDLNGDGKITIDDRTVLGNAQPKYTFGQNGSLGYRALTLNWLLRGVQGNEVVNLNRQGMVTPGGSSNMLREVLNYWTPANPTNAMTGLGVAPNSNMISRWVEDGSFVRLQNVTLGWDVPSRLTTRVGMGQLRLYASGQNLATWTKYSWYDTEASSRLTSDRTISDMELGWDDSSYPGVRTVT